MPACQAAQPRRASSSLCRLSLQAAGAMGRCQRAGAGGGGRGGGGGGGLACASSAHGGRFSYVRVIAGGAAGGSRASGFLFLFIATSPSPRRLPRKRGASRHDQKPMSMHAGSISARKRRSRRCRHAAAAMLCRRPCAASGRPSVAMPIRKDRWETEQDKQTQGCAHGLTAARAAQQHGERAGAHEASSAGSELHSRRRGENTQQRAWSSGKPTTTRRAETQRRHPQLRRRTAPTEHGSEAVDERLELQSGVGVLVLA